MICVKDECYGLLPFRSNKPQYFLSINVPSACDAYDNNIHFTNPHPRDMAEKRKKTYIQNWQARVPDHYSTTER